MLANDQSNSIGTGLLSKTVHLKEGQLHELLEFIAKELPAWRDDPDRPQATSEPDLNSQLCSYLNSACRRAGGWDFLQFRTEIGDENHKKRAIDLAPVPCNANVWVGARCLSGYDMLLPIECKRLPTPKGSNREEREYVITDISTTGGIQRFKAGYHGSAHKLGAMIGYVQTADAAAWHGKVTGWIQALVDEGRPGWTVDDQVHLDSKKSVTGVTMYRSCHTRPNSLSEIELQHLWITMH